LFESVSCAFCIANAELRQSPRKEEEMGPPSGWISHFTASPEDLKTETLIAFRKGQFPSIHTENPGALPGQVERFSRGCNA
jgi:hypothetical protein